MILPFVMNISTGNYRASARNRQKPGLNNLAFIFAGGIMEAGSEACLYGSYLVMPFAF